MASILNLKLKIWRQSSTNAKGTFQDIDAKDIPETASFLEMLDIVNQRLIDAGGDPIAFDHDCREGICGTCSMVINGIPHGPRRGDDDLPASHAEVQGRRHHLDRALPREGLPRHQGSGRGPQRL